MSKKFFSRFKHFFPQSGIIYLLVLAYCLLVGSVIAWGLPSIVNPFPYNSHEWELITRIRPELLENPLESLAQARQSLLIARGIALLFGAVTLIIFAQLCVKHLKVSPVIALLVFFLTPVWIMTSNYAEYLTLSMLVLVVLIYGVYWSIEKKLQRISFILSGLLLLAGGVIIQLHTTYVGGEVILDNPYWVYVSLKQFPALFGHGIGLLFGLSMITILWQVLNFVQEFGVNKTLKTYKKELSALGGFIIFTVMLLPLPLFSLTRSLFILLPWITLIISFAINYYVGKVSGSIKTVWMIILFLAFSLQTVEVIGWQYLKLQSDPRSIASTWIQTTLPIRITIGLEPAPTSTGLPDILIQGYTQAYYKPQLKRIYYYGIIDSSVGELPNHVILTQQEKWQQIAASDQTILKTKMQLSGHKEIMSIGPQLGILGFWVQPFDIYVSNLVPITTIGIWEKVRFPQ